MSLAETCDIPLDLHGSLDRLLKMDNTCGEAFYPSFMHKFPEIEEYFHGSNLQRLAALLPMALSVIVQHHEHHYASTRKYLEYIGSHHSLRGIPETAYPKFRDALLATLGQVLGGLWHRKLEEEWRVAIDESIETMISAYGKRVTI